MYIMFKKKTVVATSRRNITMKIKPKPEQKTNSSIDIMNFLVRSFRKVRVGIENEEPEENEEIVEKIVTRLRSIDDSEYKGATFTKKSMNEFKIFFEMKNIVFDNYAKRVLEQTLLDIDRNREPNRYNYVLQLISCKINIKACDDAVRDRTASMSVSTGGKIKKKRTKKRRAKII